MTNMWNNLIFYNKNNNISLTIDNFILFLKKSLLLGFICLFDVYLYETCWSFRWDILASNVYNNNLIAFKY